MCFREISRIQRWIDKKIEDNDHIYFVAITPIIPIRKHSYDLHFIVDDDTFELGEHISEIYGEIMEKYTKCEFDFLILTEEEVYGKKNENN